MSAPKIELWYFPIEAAAEKIRLALHIGGIPFEDNRVAFPEWAAMKPTTPGGQLPVMKIDDGEMIAQSGAMLRWAGTLGDGSLYPAADMLKIEIAMGFCDDFERSWGPCRYLGMKPEEYGYPEGYSKTEEGAALVKKMREAFVSDKMPALMEKYKAMLAKNGDFMCGPKPTIADCVIVPALRAFTKGFIDHVPVTCLEPYPEITAYIARFQAIPNVKAYYDGLAAAKAAADAAK